MYRHRRRRGHREREAIPALAANGPAADLTATPSIVYQGKTVNKHIVLGPQFAPTLLARTPALPAGRYLVTATVGAVGNPGTGGIYGSAAMTDTVTVSAGQYISVTCNSFNYGHGT